MHGRASICSTFVGRRVVALWTVEFFLRFSLRTVLSLTMSLMLRLTVSQPVCLGIKHPFGAYDKIFNAVRQLRFFMWGALSDERTGLSFTIAAGPRQRSHSRLRVPWDSQTYFTVSDFRLPFSSHTTTRMDTLEV
jgi:hypothetical protein